MRLPDGTQLMHGEGVYDPKKAHEYYLRTRELKGRKKGQVKVPSTKKSNSASSKGQEIANFLGKLPMAKAGANLQEVADLVKTVSKMSDEELKTAAANESNPAKASTMNQLLLMRASARGAFKGPQAADKTSAPAKKKDTPMLRRQKQHAAQRVASIRSELADLNKKLKDAMAETRKSEAKAKRGPTKADKNKAAREAKKYRDKNKQKLANKRKTATSKSKASGKPKADTVTSLKNKIAETKGRLDKAIQAQKALG